MTTGSSPRRRWSELHHGIDPGGIPFIRGWLRLMWALAAPLVRLRVPPTAVTILGALFAVGAAVVAPRQAVLCIVLVLLSVLCDGLDGAVAVLGDRATRGGAIADEVADRVADVAFAVVLWRCGAPWLLAAAAAASTVVLEAGRGLLPAGRTTITVGERPTRVICAALALLCAAISDATWPAAACAWVWVVLHLLAGLQLLRAGRSRPVPG